MLHCQPHCRGREAARFGHLPEAAADRSASAPCVRHRTESGTTCTARALCAHCRSVNRSLHCVHRDNVLKISAKRRISRARARLTPLGLSLEIASLGAVALVLPLGQALEENLGLSLLFDQRGIRPPPPEAVVVPIERGAADALGLANRPDQWPRALHARLIERLHAAGAAAIAFDIHFKEPRDGDDILAAAVRRAGNVVLFAYLERDTSAFAQTERLIPPTPILASAAAAVAPFALPMLPVRINRYWAVQDSAGGAATLPLAVPEQYSLPELPAFAAALDGYDRVAAARLRAALASSPAAALADLRTLAATASPSPCGADNCRGSPQSPPASRSQRVITTSRPGCSPRNSAGCRWPSRCCCKRRWRCFSAFSATIGKVSASAASSTKPSATMCRQRSSTACSSTRMACMRPASRSTASASPPTPRATPSSPRP